MTGLQAITFALTCSAMLFIGSLTFAAVAWGYRQIREANRGASE